MIINTKKMKPIIILMLFIWPGFSAMAQDSSSSKTSHAVAPAKTLKPFGPEPDPAIQVSRYIRRMLQDKSGNIWFGTQGDGACRYDGKDFVYFKREDGFSGEVVRAMLQDEQGDIWFATNGGVSRYEAASGRFFNLTVKDGLLHPQVWCMIKDKKGMFWFGTEGGVNRYDPVSGVVSAFPIPPADIKDFPNAYPAPKLVNCMLQDKDGNIWFGTIGSGVFRYDGASLVNISVKDSLCDPFVQTMIQDQAGNLWFGTRFGGLSRYDQRTEKFRTFTRKEGLNSQFIWVLYEDKGGKLWIGTAGGGLYAYDPVSAQFTNYVEHAGLANLYVQSLMVDVHGVLWVGTSGGVFRMFGEMFYNFTKNDGC
jgi:ligand-binding sensor domain-containing protein